MDTHQLCSSLEHSNILNTHSTKTVICKLKKILKLKLNTKIN